MVVGLVRVIELRKSVGKSAQHPRLSLKRGDAHAGVAIVLPGELPRPKSSIGTPMPAACPKPASTIDFLHRVGYIHGSGRQANLGPTIPGLPVYGYRLRTRILPQSATAHECKAYSDERMRLLTLTRARWMVVLRTCFYLGRVGVV